MLVVVLVIVWLCSNFICLYIARRRRLSLGVSARFIGSFLGPLAIPLVLMMKPKAI